MSSGKGAQKNTQSQQKRSSQNPQIIKKKPSLQKIKLFSFFTFRPTIFKELNSTKVP